jgi:predicted acetyltransferase
MELDLRAIGPDDLERCIRAAERGFSAHSSEDHIRHGKALIELDRTIAMFDGSEVVGTAAASSFDMTVPGGSLPTAGVAFVTVQPTHRRRGILRQMMIRQLGDIHERGEPLACLWASESIIYGRFGYGMATFNERWSIDKRHTDFIQIPALNGRLRFIDTNEAKEVFPGVYERVRSTRNGGLRRTRAMWNEELGDPEIIRGGGTAYFFVVYENEGSIDGYVKYRVHHSDRRIFVHELMSVTDEAYAALWQYCFGIDLMDTVEARNRPVDDPLVWMLADPRRLQRRTSDAMWIRIIDVCTALASRKYIQERRVVFEVKDDVCRWNHGRCEIEAGPEGGECRPTQKTPDISLTMADLSAAYLGGTSFNTLCHAGRVVENKGGAIKRADALFRTERLPWPTHDF